MLWSSAWAVESHVQPEVTTAVKEDISRKPWQAETELLIHTGALRNKFRLVLALSDYFFQLQCSRQPIMMSIDMRCLQHGNNVKDEFRSNYRQNWFCLSVPAQYCSRIHEVLPNYLQALQEVKKYLARTAWFIIAYASRIPPRPTARLRFAT